MAKPKVSDLPPAGFTVLQRTSRMGKSEVLVSCKGCNAERYLYIWSWSGLGIARCGSGEHKLSIGHPQG